MLCVLWLGGGGAQYQLVREDPFAQGGRWLQMFVSGAEVAEMNEIFVHC